MYAARIEQSNCSATTDEVTTVSLVDRHHTWFPQFLRYKHVFSYSYAMHGIDLEWHDDHNLSVWYVFGGPIRVYHKQQHWRDVEITIVQH